MRKQPRQQRSRAMVNDILEATTLCIARHGIEGTSTRKVADIAGISVGSLYQYFSDRDSLVEAVLERLTDDVLARVLEVLPRLGGTDLQASVRILLGAVADLLDEKEGRYLALLRHWNQVGMEPSVRRIESKMMEIIGMMASRSRMPVRNLPLTAYLLINSGIFNMVRYFSNPSPYFSREELIDGLAELVDASLRAASAQP